jgi:hypothetical protein
MLDEVKQREVCALISAGCSVAHAARYVGCSARTIRRHAERDESFAQRLRRSETGIRLTALETIRKASATHWRAAAWLIRHAGALPNESEEFATQRTNQIEDMLDDIATGEALPAPPEPANGVAKLADRINNPLNNATHTKLGRD